MRPIVIISLYQIDSFGVRSIYSYLRSKGIDAHIVFLKEWMFLRRLSIITKKENILLTLYLKKIKPAIVGISVRSIFANDAKLITDVIKKEFPDTIIIWGGTHPTIDPDGCISHCDGLVIGEGEKPMEELIMTIDTSAFYSVKNTWVWKGEDIVKNPSRELNNLDELPFQDLENDHKIHIANDTVNYGDPLINKIVNGDYTFMASRGCPYNCTYCSNRALALRQTNNPSKFLRWRNVDLVITELKYIKKRFHIKSFSSNDEVFILNRQWFREFSEKYFREINLPFRCQVHPNEITEENLKIFRTRLDLKSISIGIQAGNEKTRFMVYKRNTPDAMLIDKAKLLKNYNILVYYDFIIDNPLDDISAPRDILELLLKFPRPFGLNLYKLHNLPGTELTNMLLHKGIITEDDIDGIHTSIYTEKRSSLILNRLDSKNKNLVYYINLIFLLGTILEIKTRHKIYTIAPVPVFIIRYFMNKRYYWFMNNITQLIRLHSVFYSFIGYQITTVLTKVDNIMSIITRYYMKLKIELNYLRENKNR